MPYQHLVSIFSVISCVTKTVNDRTVILILIGINIDLELKLELIIWGTTDFGAKQCEIKPPLPYRSILIRDIYTYLIPGGSESEQINEDYSIYI